MITVYRRECRANLINIPKIFSDNFITRSQIYLRSFHQIISKNTSWNMAYALGHVVAATALSGTAVGVVGFASPTARGETNLLPPMRDALRAHCTVGEICEALREEWGMYDSLRARA